MLSLDVPRNLAWKKGPEHFVLPAEDSEAFDLDSSFDAKFHDFVEKNLIAGSYQDPKDSPFVILRRIGAFTKVYIFKIYVSKDFIFKACFLGDFDEIEDKIISLDSEFFIVSPRQDLKGLSRQETSKEADKIVDGFRRQICLSPELVEFVQCNGFTFRYGMDNLSRCHSKRA